MQNYYMPNNFRNYGYQPQFNYQQQSQTMQQPMQQSVQQPISQIMQQSIYLQGKSVDSIEVVKAMDIPLDGSISYFPITDGSAIVSKQLQMDGTSKTIVYKPVNETDVTIPQKYVTDEELKKMLEKYDNKPLKDDIKSIKRELKDLAQDIKDMEEK